MSNRDRPPRRSYESEVDEARRRGVVLDGIATSTPYDYSALDPKSMEERGIGQSRRKPKFPYVSFHGRTKYAHVNQSYENPMRLATYQAKI